MPGVRWLCVREDSKAQESLNVRGKVRIPHLTRKQAAGLLTLAVCCLAVTLWLGLRSRDTPSNSSRPRACEEWERAEAAGQDLGWDLTYMAALKKAGVCPGNPLCGEWAKPAPPIHKHIAEWQGDPITSSMEIELPDGHAGYGIIWLIRTKDNAYYWSFHSSNLDNPRIKMAIEAQHYDSAFEAIACWRQGEPPNRIFGPKGYIGFLSLYKEGRSRQMLLTHDDLFEGNSDPDEGKPGRFWVAMMPLVRSVDEQQKGAAQDRK